MRSAFRSLAEDIDTTTPAGSSSTSSPPSPSARKRGYKLQEHAGASEVAPAAFTPAQKAEVHHMRDDESRAISEIARLFEASERTVRRA